MKKNDNLDLYSLGRNYNTSKKDELWIQKKNIQEDEKISSKTLGKLRHYHENINLDEYFMLEDVDASDENELVNGEEPKNTEATKDDLKDELLEALMDECDASETNDIENGLEPKDVKATKDDIEDELSQE